MRYALDTYQYIALGCAALVLFIIIQSLIIFLLGTYKRRADARRAVERLWNLPRGEPLEVQPAVSSGMLLPVGTEVQPILEHAEPPEVQPAVSPEVPLPVGSKVWAVCNFGRVTEGAPGIIIGAVDVRFFWQSPTYLCTFANNMKVHARPKDIERYNHGHSLEELEQPDFDSILSRRMTLRAQQLLSWQRSAHLPSAGSTECRTKLQN